MGRQTVGEVLIRKIGLRRSVMVATMLTWWLMFRETEGRHPKNNEELADAVGVHRATIYRYVATFREVFGESPERYVESAYKAGQRAPVMPKRVLSWRVV